MNYESIKAEAKVRGCRVKDLVVLAVQNDPFYCGSPAQVTNAKWFVEQWERCGKQHDRETHYRLANGKPQGRKPDGTTYQNTDSDWAFLEMASKGAKYLGLIDSDDWTDRRNKNALTEHDDGSGNPEPDIVTYGRNAFEYGYEMPSLPEMRALPDGLPTLPHLTATGYDGIEQPYLVEVWVEKDGMNYILEPLCREEKVNLVTGTGELSITAASKLFMERALHAMDSERPTRILYISDYDPAGVGMPVSIARKIEHRLYTQGYDVDIGLIPLVLTPEQVKKYDLPRIPNNKKDKRWRNFENVHGEGRVELSALEGIHPGEFARIVKTEIRRYRDWTLDRQALEQEAELQEALNDACTQVYSEHKDKLDKLGADYKKLREEQEAFRQEFAEMAKVFQPKRDALQKRWDGVKKRMEKVYGTVLADVEAINIDPDDYPLPEPEVAGDPEDVLYDSSRDYFEQLAVYKKHQNGKSDSG